MTIGPPRSLCTPDMPKFHTGTLSPQYHGRQAVFSPAGKLYFADYRHDRILTWDDLAGPPRVFAPMYNVGRVAVDSSGRWIAGTAVNMFATRVWDARDTRAVLDVPEGRTAAFSADGCWLAVAAHFKVLIYDTRRWTLAHEINLKSADLAACQPGGRLLAVTGPEQQVHLYDVESAQFIARLPRVEGAPISDLAFSPDGRQLAVVQRDTGVTLWDLVELERELADLGLSLPGGKLVPGAAAPSPSAATPPGEVLVDRGELPPADEWFQCWHRLALNEASRGNWPDAVNNLEQAIRLHPGGRPAGELADMLTERGVYQSRNDQWEAARDSWEQSYRLVPWAGEATRRLVRLHLLGHVAIRSTDWAALLMELHANEVKNPKEQEVLRALVEIRRGQFASGLERLSRTEIPPGWRIEAAYFTALSRHGLGENAQASAALAVAVSLHDAEEATLDTDRHRELEQLREEVESLITASPQPAK